MPQNESFYGYLRRLVEECRDALGGDGSVDDPREYRFDIEFPDRRYAFQGYPEENRIFVGQYLGDRGVVWFDELNYDDLHHGWRSTNESSYDFVRSLIKKPSLTLEQAREQAEEAPQSGHKESTTSLERHPHAKAFAERVTEHPSAASRALTADRRTERGAARRLLHSASRAYSIYKQVRSMSPTPWKVTKWAVNRALGRNSKMTSTRREQAGER